MMFKKENAMSILFINACFRKESRTLRLAKIYLENKNANFTEIKPGDMELPVLNTINTEKYCSACTTRDFSASMFDYGKQFAQADEIVIAAPFWNFSIPAQLHVYLELVCSQGATFDIDSNGNYNSLCKAKKLTYITTAGGQIPEQDHAWCYIKDLAQIFWSIPELEYYKAEGLDIVGNDVEKILADVFIEKK